RVEIEGVEVSIRPLSRAGFDYQLELRTEELKKSVLDGTTTPALMEIRQVPDGIGHIYDFAKSGYAFDRAWELMAWRDGFCIRMEVETTDMAKTQRLGKDDTRRTDVEEKYTHLLNVYGRLRGRSDEEIPSEPGDCFAHGFLKGGPLEDVAITTFYHLQDAPDVFVMFSHSTQVWEDDTML
ncbi:T6SS immunity protein Tli4 family protein, partial [Cutibacterium acnes]